jgi:hypothetical protein
MQKTGGPKSWCTLPLKDICKHFFSGGRKGHVSKEEKTSSKLLAKRLMHYAVPYS